MSNAWYRYLPAFLREKIEGRHDLRNALGNTGWLLADNILRMGVGLLVSIWVTRYLGPERFGALSYATAFVTLFSPVAMLGLEGIVVRNIVRNPSNRDEILGSSFILKLIGGALAFAVTLTAIALVRPADHQARVLVGITAIGMLFQMFGAVDFWFQSQVQSRYSAYSRSAANITICAVKVLLICFHAPLAAFACAGAAEIALGSLGLVVAYRLNGHHITRWRATWVMAKELLRDSWPLFFTDIVIMIYMRIDKIMIGGMSGNTELGVYSVAAMLAEALYFIPMAVAVSVYPSIVEAKGISENFFHERMQRYYNLMALLAYAVALPLTFLAGWLIPFMFGDLYRSAGPMLIGLVWVGMFVNLTIARGQYLITMNWMRLHFITDFLGCGLNVSLNYYLIPRYGGMGAVTAALISYWFLAHGLCFIYKPLVGTGTMMTKAILYPKIW